MRNSKRLPLYLEPGSPCRFPDPRLFDADGMVAVGGDLSVARLLAAYRSGIFPWYDEAIPPLWWSPDPRAILTLEDLHVARSLARSMRRGEFELSWNRCFAEVMLACGENRLEGTWVIPEMVDAYHRLHQAGHAHSLEVWAGGDLVGGIYGVQAGGLFAAESMFHRRTDASKIALVVLMRSVFAAGVELFDVQFLTPHLESLGAQVVRRADYLRRLCDVRDKDVDLRDLALRAP